MVKVQGLENFATLVIVPPVIFLPLPCVAVTSPINKSIYPHVVAQYL
jgi:hypothetical protein